MIELESQSKAAESRSDGRRGRKRGLERGQDEIVEDQYPKRHKRNATDSCSLSDIEDEPLSKRTGNGHRLYRSPLQKPDQIEIVAIRRSRRYRIPARGKDIGKQEGGHRAVSPLRRSARIAAHQESSKCPVVQAPTPPSSTGSHARSKSQLAKSSKRSLA